MAIHLIHDLEKLHHDILALCAKVEEMVDRAVDTLGRVDYDLSTELARQDDEVDRRDVEIEDECLKILALHQPVADDLRRIAAVLKITGELERVADIAVHIAERAHGLQGPPHVQVPPKLKQMSRAALDMLHRAIDAYVEMDSRIARKVCAQDDFVDELNREIISELTGRIKESPGAVEPLLHLFSASRHVERIADHATNIAEDVVFLVEGEIIRHRTRSNPAPESHEREST